MICVLNTCYCPIGHYNPSFRITTQQQFKVAYERVISEKLFTTNFFINSQSFCQKSVSQHNLEDTKAIYFSNFLLIEISDLKFGDFKRYLCNVIHIHWPLQSFSQNYDLASHNNYVVCVYFIHDWRDIRFKVDSEPQIFEKLFMAILFTLRIFERKSPKKYFHIFVQMSDLGV